ncbi:MAG: hypothetical protein IKH57_17570 [Clostridia bacterium]|nr:hypothetical protein [Clostridia bacterium]
MKKRILVLSLILCLALTLVPAAASAANGITEFPQVVTAFMKTKFECGCSATGTGGMIAANGLITAGHNLVCAEHNKPARSIDFYFGSVSSSDYWYKYSGKFTTFVFCDFSNGFTTENDIGIVKFPYKIAKNVGGWYGSQTRSTSEYEGVRGFTCFYDASGKGLVHQGDMSAYDNTRIFLDHKPLGAGADGAPVYFMRGAARNPALIGVYSAGKDGKCVICNITYDVFSKMMDELVFELD